MKKNTDNNHKDILMNTKSIAAFMRYIKINFGYDTIIRKNGSHMKVKSSITGMPVLSIPDHNNTLSRGVKRDLIHLILNTTI